MSPTSAQTRAHFVYSGADVRLILSVPHVYSRRLTTANTISISTHQDKFSSKTLGQSRPPAIATAYSTISGSIVFPFHDLDAFSKELSLVFRPKDVSNVHVVHQDLPPMNIFALFMTEGSLSVSSPPNMYSDDFVGPPQMQSQRVPAGTMLILEGVELMALGMVPTQEQSDTQQTFTYIARDFRPARLDTKALGEVSNLEQRDPQLLEALPDGLLVQTALNQLEQIHGRDPFYMMDLVARGVTSMQHAGTSSLNIANMIDEIERVDDTGTVPEDDPPYTDPDPEDDPPPEEEEEESPLKDYGTYPVYPPPGHVADKKEIQHALVSWEIAKRKERRGRGGFIGSSEGWRLKFLYYTQGLTPEEQADYELRQKTAQETREGMEDDIVLPHSSTSGGRW